MYKVIYQKNNGKVVGVYPIKYETVKEFDVESGKEIEVQVDKTQVFFNEKDYALVQIETIPEIGTNQYRVYENKRLLVKNDNSLLIAELKQKLASTDYQAIKYAEGQISKEDYEPIKVQRQVWRDEINSLETNKIL